MNRFLALVGETETRLVHRDDPEIPVHRLDQLKAATAETEVLITEHAMTLLDKGNMAGYTEYDGPNARRSAMVLACFLVPNMAYCDHSDQIRPLLALMPLRVAVCRQCAGADFPRRVSDTCCDFCGEVVDDNEFWPITIRFNHLTAAGDACGECSAAILKEYSR